MQAAELLAVETGDADTFAGVNPVQGAAAQAFADSQLVPPARPHAVDTDPRSLLTAQKYNDDAPVDTSDVISARILGAEPSKAVVQAPQESDTDDGEQLMLVTGDGDAAADTTDKTGRLVSTNRESVTTSSIPVFLRGDAVADPTAVAGRRQGERRLTISDAAGWWMSPDSMLLGGVLVFLAVGLVVNRARRRQKLKMDVPERDVLDGQAENGCDGEQQELYVVLM